MLRISKKISSVSLKRFPARILWCCCKHESDLTCKTNILYGTCGHVENPEIIFFLEILQQKKNLTWRDFFGPVAFGRESEFEQSEDETFRNVNKFVEIEYEMEYN
jgi:hypothetical protein